MNRIEEIEKEYLKKEIPEFSVGNTVIVRVKIEEAGKERIQLFEGAVIARKGRGLNEMFTVRRIVQGGGVERTFPLHSPFVVDVEVRKKSAVRRAKLYYLRKRSGKAARL